MLTVTARQGSGKTCDGVSRRDFLRLGALGVGGLTLADLFRLQAQGTVNPRAAHKSVIMIFLQGGPSHIDMYDLKPKAPAEYRGEYKPIQTTVPGIDICELFPLQAKIADKLALVRNMQFTQKEHGGPVELQTGFLKEGNRPAFGSVISRLERDAGRIGALPPFVAFDNNAYPAYLGAAHKPFVPGADLKTLALPRGMTLENLRERRHLLGAFDTLNRDLDNARGTLAGMDAFTAQALEMVSSPKARDAFDLGLESKAVKERYGPATQLLQARRLVEAGVKVVTLTFIGTEEGRKPCGFGGGTWDTHGDTYKCLGSLMPQLDRALYALVTDLHERGLDKDVAVVVWGEFGRTPKISDYPPRAPGRGHWSEAGFALLAGGGLRMGQVVGATDSRGGRPTGVPNLPQNVLATLYHVLGIDLDTTLPDHQMRPVYLLDDRRKIEELL